MRHSQCLFILPQISVVLAPWYYSLNYGIWSCHLYQNFKDGDSNLQRKKKKVILEDHRTALTIGNYMYLFQSFI
jgi:hypothetical protein